jgi:LysR family transcriptional regulator, nod-box dependent transcriptional activator
MSRFDLNLLVSLDALLEERNVTAAADRMGVSQPTMSGMLNRLRMQLQDPLLVQVGGRYELTRRAQYLREQLRQTLLKVNGMLEAKAAASLSEVGRNLVVMASELSQLTLLPQVFRQALKSAPGLSFEVVPIQDPIGAVSSGKVDICLTGLALDHIHDSAAEIIRTRSVRVVTFTPIADARHPLQSPISLEQFWRYPHVETHFPGVSTTLERQMFSNVPDAQRSVIRVPSFIAVGPAVLHTEMLGLIPSQLLPMMQGMWNIKPLEFAIEPQKTTIRLLWHVRFDKDPVHQIVRSLITEIAGQPWQPQDEATRSNI